MAAHITDRRRTRWPRGRCLAAAAVVAALLAAPPRGAVEVRTVAHRGFDDCIALSAGRTKLIVVPAWAGRISLLDFGQGNELLRAPAIDGKTLDRKAEWIPWDGNATDVVRRDGKKQWRRLWLHRWPEVAKLADGVRLASEVNDACHLAAARRYRLADDGRSVTQEFTITARQGPARQWTIWERALVPGGGYVLAPVARDKAFPAGWIVRDGGKVEPADRVRTVGGFLCVRSGTKRGVGLAARLRAGWIAHVRGSFAMVLRFGIDPRGAYPHYGGAHVVFWIAENAIELEPLSPEVELAPGRSATFTQTWRSLALPKTVDPADPAAVGRWIERPCTGKVGPPDHPDGSSAA